MNSLFSVQEGEVNKLDQESTKKNKVLTKSIKVSTADVDPDARNTSMAHGF